MIGISDIINRFRRPPPSDYQFQPIPASPPSPTSPATLPIIGKSFPDEALPIIASILYYSGDFWTLLVLQRTSKSCWEHATPFIHREVRIRNEFGLKSYFSTYRRTDEASNYRREVQRRYTLTFILDLWEPYDLTEHINMAVRAIPAGPVFPNGQNLRLTERAALDLMWSDREPVLGNLKGVNFTYKAPKGYTFSSKRDSVVSFWDRNNALSRDQLKTKIDPTTLSYPQADPDPRGQEAAHEIRRLDTGLKLNLATLNVIYNDLIPFKNLCMIHPWNGLQGGVNSSGNENHPWGPLGSLGLFCSETVLDTVNLHESDPLDATAYFISSKLTRLLPVHRAAFMVEPFLAISGWIGNRYRSRKSHPHGRPAMGSYLR